MSSIIEIENQWNLYKTIPNHQPLEEWVTSYDWANIIEKPNFKFENYIVEGEILTRLKFLVVKHISLAVNAKLVWLDFLINREKDIFE